MNSKEPVVISIGGSLVVPDHIDVNFLTELKALIESQLQDTSHSFILIAGGGKTARRYQDAAKAVSHLDNEDIDWIGIHSTRLNAHLLRTIFRDTAHPVIMTNPDDVLDVPPNTPLIIGAGYRPGSSSDLQAVRIAARIGAKKMINLSNIDYVYTDDPKENPSAKKIEDITWEDFKKLIPEEWDPGLSSPFDPVAARRAEQSDIEVAVINGQKFEELKKYLSGESFVGTRIHP